MALPALATGSSAETLRMYSDLELIQPQTALRSSVQALWSLVLLCEIEGSVWITGILPGQLRSERLERGLLLTSKADFQRNTILTEVGVVSGVLIHDAPTNQAEDLHPAASIQMSTSPQVRRGRPPKHDWPGLMERLAVRLVEYGVPLDGEKAELERWAASVMLTEPAESEIRIRVTKAIEAHRKSIG